MSKKSIPHKKAVKLDEPVYKAFKIWVEKLGYEIQPMKRKGFFFIAQGQHGYVTDRMIFSPLAKSLLNEFLRYYNEDKS